MNISRQFAEPNFMACSHVVGESNVLLRNTLARCQKEFTQLGADDFKKLRSYGCEFTEIHDRCKELSTCTRRRSNLNSIMQCLSKLQQCLDSVICLLRSSHNAHQASEHLTNVLSTVAHEGLALIQTFTTLMAIVSSIHWRLWPVATTLVTTELRAIAMNQFSTYYQQGLYEAIIASQSLGQPVQEYNSRMRISTKDNPDDCLWGDNVALMYLCKAKCWNVRVWSAEAACVVQEYNFNTTEPRQV